MHITLQINGTSHQLDIDPRTTLLDALRQHLGQTATKKGCDHGQCGACTALMDGRRTNAYPVAPVAAVPGPRWLSVRLLHTAANLLSHSHAGGNCHRLASYASTALEGFFDLSMTRSPNG